jgi:L-aminopeptidase/D-esterase-like protein
MVANSVGGIWDDDLHEWVAPLTNWDRSSSVAPGANTTIGAVLTDARLTKEQANRVATVAHDGIGRAVRPAHTVYDGDTIFCLATGAIDAPADLVEVVAADVVARAIAAGVRAARPLGIPPGTGACGGVRPRLRPARDEMVERSSRIVRA